MHNDKHKVEKLAEEGIRAYVSKECDLDILRQAILEVQQNGYYFNENFPKELLQQLINENKIRPNYRFTAFSERELQIIRLICQEKTTAEIADQLCLSPRTIEGIRASILDRIAARSTIGLVMYAMKHGLVPPK